MLLQVLTETLAADQKERTKKLASRVLAGVVDQVLTETADQTKDKTQTSKRVRTAGWKGATGSI